MRNCVRLRLNDGLQPICRDISHAIGNIDSRISVYQGLYQNIFERSHSSLSAKGKRKKSLYENSRHVREARFGLTKTCFQLSTITCSQSRLFPFSILANLIIPRTPATSRLTAITFDLALFAKLARNAHGSFALLAIRAWIGVNIAASMACEDSYIPRSLSLSSSSSALVRRGGPKPTLPLC